MPPACRQRRDLKPRATNLAWGHSQSSNESIGRAVTKTKGARSRSHCSLACRPRIEHEAVAEVVSELASFMIALRAGAVTWFENLRRWISVINPAHPYIVPTMRFVLGKNTRLTDDGF